MSVIPENESKSERTKNDNTRQVYKADIYRLMRRNKKIKLKKKKRSVASRIQSCGRLETRPSVYCTTPYHKKTVERINTTGFVNILVPFFMGIEKDFMGKSSKFPSHSIALISWTSIPNRGAAKDFRTLSLAWDVFVPPPLVVPPPSLMIEDETSAAVVRVCSRSSLVSSFLLSFCISLENIFESSSNSLMMDARLFDVFLGACVLPLFLDGSIIFDALLCLCLLLEYNRKQCYCKP